MEIKTARKAGLPAITFAVVTLNEEKRIRKCLSAIYLQDYPKNKMEVIIMDGCSTDKTLVIAKEFKATVYFNKEKLAEPGLALAYKKARGDYTVFMAADNIIFDNSWTRKMVQPFLDDPVNIVASYCRVVHPPSDNIWNKYMNEDAEPFSAFVFEDTSHPEKFRKAYSVTKETDDYVVYNFTLGNFPLIALAQCFVLKTGLKRRRESKFDDIQPLIEVIKNKEEMAYVKNTGIYHLSVKDFSNLCQKLKRRVYNSISTGSYAARDEYVSFKRKVRRYLFLLYSLSVLFPFIDGVKMSLKKREPYALIHPIVSLIIAYYIFLNFMKIKVWRK